MKTTIANFGAVPDLYGESDAGVDANDLLWHVFRNTVEIIPYRLPTGTGPLLSTARRRYPQAITMPNSKQRHKKRKTKLLTAT